MALSAVLFACGSDDNDSTSGGTATTESIEESTEAGGGAVAQTPKKLGVLQLLGAVDVTIQGTQAIEEAAEVLEWDVTTSDSQGDPQKGTTGLNQLVAQGMDGIFDAGPFEPVAIRQGLTAAERADIPVAAIWGEVASTDGLVANYTPPDEEMGEISVEALEELLPKGGTVAQFTSPAFAFGKVRDQVFNDSIGADPKWDVVATHATDYLNIQGDTTKATTDILNANPDLEAIWADASVQIPGIATVLRQKGLCGKVKVVGFYAETLNLKAVRDGCVSTILDPPIKAQSWADMDLMAGQLIDGEPMPPTNPTSYPFNPWEIITITKDTLPANPDEFPDVEFDYVSYFTEKWGKGEYGAP